MVEHEPKGWETKHQLWADEEGWLAAEEIHRVVGQLRRVIELADDEEQILLLKRNITWHLRRAGLIELERPSYQEIVHGNTSELPSESDLREEIRVLLLKNTGGHPKYAYSNQLLDDIVKIKPRTKSDLRKIKGMGTRRMESSDEILEIIEKWLMRRDVGVQFVIILIHLSPTLVNKFYR